MREPGAAREALRSAIAEQIERGEPPETKATLERLLGSGVPEEQAWRLLMYALLGELDEMMRAGRSFSRTSYRERLARLPAIDPGPMGAS